VTTSQYGPPGAPAPPDGEAPGAGEADGARLIRLGSLLGVPVFIAPSWLLIVVIVTLSYADFLRQQIPGTSSAASYLLALLFAVALGACVVAHELGHTIAGRLLGMRVRRIVIFLLGGVSELEGEARRPRDEFVIAAAGPLASFGLAVGFWLLAHWPATDSATGVLLILLAWSNLVIAVFNVLPGLPLDGGRLVQATVWTFSHSRLAGIRAASWSGRVLAVLLAGAVVLANLGLHGDSGARLSALTAMVLGLSVAGFLWFGAGQSLRGAELSDRTSNLQLGHLIRPSVYLPGDAPLSEALRHLSAARAAGIVVIDAQGRSRAIVGEDQVRAVEHGRRPWVTLAELSRPLEPGLILADDLTGPALVAAVRATPASEYLVIGGDGVSRGVLAISDLARALRLRYVAR
jgi:Zn-dependent protease